MNKLRQFSVFATKKHLHSYSLKSVRTIVNTSNENSNVGCQEIRIPVPWGHIAGKWWGPQNKRPILVLHGWQDNCGSFDKLIPLLPNDVGYLAIDFPGHGYSSPIPNGMFYYFTNWPIMIRQIRDHFQWPKCTILGHSMGSITGFTFGSLFPHLVDFVICLDGLNPVIYKERVEKSIKSIEDFIKYDLHNSSDTEPPSYTFEEMEQILHKATKKSIDIPMCKYILQRNILPSKVNPGKYYFARDSRLKCGPILSWIESDCLELARRVNFPLLLTVATSTMHKSQMPIMEGCLSILKENNEKFERQIFNGTHHVHLNDPEQVAKVLIPFILKHNTENREIGIGDINKCIKV